MLGAPPVHDCIRIGEYASRPSLNPQTLTSWHASRDALADPLTFRRLGRSNHGSERQDLERSLSHTGAHAHVKKRDRDLEYSSSSATLWDPDGDPFDDVPDDAAMPGRAAAAAADESVMPSLRDARNFGDSGLRVAAAKKGRTLSVFSLLNLGDTGALEEKVRQPRPAPCRVLVQQSHPPTAVKVPG